MDEWLTEAALAEAIDGGDLWLEYQPRIDLRTGECLGLEGLIRWQHREHGLVSPDRFVLLAERSGLIDRLTDCVLLAGLRDLTDWSDCDSLVLSLNISSMNLHDLELVERLSMLCARHKIAPRRVALELTETAALADRLNGAYVLNRLRLKGFHLSIDDFGTGYSSLSQLARLPFSDLKVDKSFVMDMLASAEARTIVRSTIDLAHNLGMQAVAEGVEDEATLHQLVALGCDAAQGYFVARPMRAADLPAWLTDWEQRRDGILTRAPVVLPAYPAEFAWSKHYDGSDEMRLALGQLLADQIQPIWDLGRKSLIGWRPKGRGLEVLMAPYQQIVDRFAECQRLLQGRRLMGDGTFRTVRTLMGVRPDQLTLPFAVADHAPGAVPTDAIEQVLRRYGITETQHRAVSLFDIVGFSKVEPQAQVAQLNSLECSINTAHGILQDLGKSIDLARTTTGDGFYIWNREKGAEADLDTYLLTMLTLADNAIARRGARPEMVPMLRTCFSVGPHYSYYQIEGLDPHGHDYIVGDVTIGLARMVGKCQPGQILIGDFRRPTEVGTMVTDPLEFVIKADGTFAAFDDVRLHGSNVSGIRCYLTGEPRNDGGFRVQRFRILDKHGFEHFVFNQKFNIHLSGDGSAAHALYLGRRHSDLIHFDGLEVAAD
jgi:EAL domain-containing protein (putative c-di-GMP-specific phosphodiesterase class I)